MLTPLLSNDKWQNIQQMSNFVLRYDFEQVQALTHIHFEITQSSSFVCEVQDYILKKSSLF